MKQDEIGCTQIYLKEDPDPFQLHPDEYSKVREAWMKGEAFYTGRDCYGEAVTLKLGQVVAISESTAAVRAQAREDRKTDKMRDGDD